MCNVTYNVTEVNNKAITLGPDSSDVFITS